MRLFIIMVYFLAVHAFPIDKQDNADVCPYTPDKFTTGIGLDGYLKLDESIPFNVTDLIFPKDIVQCQYAVSPNCFECNGAPLIYCNNTTSEDIKYLMSSQPIESLHLNLQNFKEMHSAFLGDLNLNMLEFEEGDGISSDICLLQNIKNLSTLVMRVNQQLFQNLTDCYSNWENLTTLIVDLSSNSLIGGEQDPSSTSRHPEGQEGIGMVDPPGIPAKLPHGADRKNDGNFNDSGITIILPKLRVYGLISGTPTENDNLWIKNSPIEYLYLQNCDISAGSMKEFLTGFKKTLKYLDIHNSLLRKDNIPESDDDFHESILEEILLSIKDSTNQTKLVGFSATSMELTNIPYGALETMKDSLQYLSLYKNDFSNLRPRENVSSHDFSPDEKRSRIFPPLSELLELDLSECNIQSLGSDIFAEMPNLRVILLSHNRLIQFHSDSFRHLNALKFLDLTKNDNIGSQQGIENINFTNVPFLDILDVSGTQLLKKSRFSGELRNLKQLAMCNSLASLNDIDTRLFDTMESLETLNLSGNLAINGTVGNQYFSGLKSLKELYLVQCSLNSLVLYQRTGSLNESLHFSDLISLKLLDLSWNAISFIKDKSFYMPQTLETLVLNNNNIANWESPILSNLTYLKELHLRNNYLTSITEAMNQDFSKLHKLSITGNHFKCGCDTKEFAEMVTTKEANKSFNLEGWFEDQNICTDERSILDIPFKKYVNNDCIKNKTDLRSKDSSNSNRFVVFFSIALVILLLTLVIVVTYYKWRDIKFFAILIKNATILSFSGDEPELEKKGKIYNYDVFISYSDPNRKWVLDELLPNLEIRGNVKVCLHERDFQVGLSILENIISCMDQSKCIMLIVSLSFVKSNWCQFELHLAQHRLLETKRENLILVLLEDIPRSKRSKMLSYLMKTKTYIVWPQSAEDQEARKFFWKRIYQSVVLQKLKSEKLISFA